MASAANHPYAFPDVPPSHSAGGHEMRDYYAPQDAPRPVTNQAPYLTPYLGLRARLSQVWINRWTILLLLVLVRVLIATANLNDNLGSARTEALSACTSVESVGSAMASMPHYMSRGVNELAASGIEKTVSGLMSLLDLIVTGVEEMVVFYIGLLTSTYLCLITLAVRGSLHTVIEAAEFIGDGLNKTLDAVGDDIANVADSFQDEVNKLIDGINSIPQIFGGDGMDKLNLTSQIDELKDLQLPSGYDQGLEKLNSSIPTFDQVKNLTDSAIRLPFELVKQLINEKTGNYTFNNSMFPVPAKEKLTFCSDSNGINDFFDGLVETEVVARRAFIGVIIALAVLVCAPVAWREIKRWQTMQRRAQLVSQSAHDPLDVVYIASRPYSSSIGIWLANRFGSTRRQTAVRWAVAYATSTPALLVLCLGLAGLFACLCQYILLKTIEKEVPELTQQVGAFADKVVFALNNASESWANGTNEAIGTFNTDLNDDLFSWVNTSTQAVNDTLNVFVDEMSDALNATFGGTILYEPIKDVLNCLVVMKIEGIQKGLTWVHDNAHVDLPTLSNDTFSLGAAASLSGDSSDDSFLASPGSESADKVSDAIVKLVNKLKEGVRIEAIISTCIVLIWVTVLIIGIVRALMVFSGSGKTRAEGGQRYVSDPETDRYRGHDAPIHVASPPRPSDAAPPYEYVNKAAPYTIVPRPFPNFNQQQQQHDNFSEVPMNNEKVGDVGASHPVGLAVSRPAQERTSKVGSIEETTPTNEKSGGGRSWNPFT
ncbi:plasma membrane fusion protein prm1 [Diplodia corticola]|uniref:Plasma membrane fusion protein PRM1 n=1 Tax=Diplodia corticola TaxID=236234 RepID=A0A1J9QTP0_9PEZI|nr:plasma membrane fusion protein prm1 [Diplodia corticola]OJD31761.1 plasma membrane fusion protein prm1 [Diplodia corticola]